MSKSIFTAFPVRLRTDTSLGDGDRRRSASARRPDIRFSRRYRTSASSTRWSSSATPRSRSAPSPTGRAGHPRSSSRATSVSGPARPSPSFARQETPPKHPVRINRRGLSPTIFEGESHGEHWRHVRHVHTKRGSGLPTASPTNASLSGHERSGDRFPFPGIRLGESRAINH